MGLLVVGGAASAQPRNLTQPDQQKQSIEQVLRKQAEQAHERLTQAQPSSLNGQSAAAREVKAVSAPLAAGSLRCLPTCSSTDGRFLAIAGTAFDTLSPPEMYLSIAVPADAATFDIGIFDGDGSEYNADGITYYWDGGETALFEYSLYADPAANGTGTIPVDLEPGSPVILSSDMPDNEWRDFTVSTGPEAASPSGNFFYVLKIELAFPSLVTLNSFKVRTTAVVGGLTLDPVARPFSYIAPLTSESDLAVIYPSYPAASPTTYDGNFLFYFDVPVSQNELVLWDGDFDLGKWDLTEQDTDDPNTPGFPFLPPWSTLETLPEGVAIGGLGTGSPADDGSGEGFGIYTLRPPSVQYQLVAPDGQIFLNGNPSGNIEWERFRVSTDPFDPSTMDASAPVLPAGTYKLEIQGVDMLNLNALLLPYRVLCVDEEGTPCVPLRPFLVGDTVFRDDDGDGVQDAGEPGIPGVTLELHDELGTLIATTTTDADGNYSFGVDAGTYEVHVATSNFAAGGPLAGTESTTGGDTDTATVTDDNELDLDFGYRGNASIGDRVWNDADADGFQDFGEAGLNGVTIRLLDGDGNVVATAVTSGDGNYTFSNLAGGTYTVSVDGSTLPAGYTPTADPDGLGTPNQAAVTVAAGASVTTADFGYRAPSPPSQPGTGTIGYWKNHPEAWPVSQITIGGITYSKSQAITLMGAPGKGDKTYDLFKQLVAAKLNVLIGNDASCISSTISSADSWMASHPVGSKVKSSSSDWTVAGPLHERLDTYNNGGLCAPHRD